MSIGETGKICWKQFTGQWGKLVFILKKPSRDEVCDNLDGMNEDHDCKKMYGLMFWTYSMIPHSTLEEYNRIEETESWLYESIIT